MKDLILQMYGTGLTCQRNRNSSLYQAGEIQDNAEPTIIQPGDGNLSSYEATKRDTTDYHHDDYGSDENGTETKPD
jgi:hypothetical protein